MDAHNTPLNTGTGGSERRRRLQWRVRASIDCAPTRAGCPVTCRLGSSIIKIASPTAPRLATAPPGRATLAGLTPATATLGLEVALLFKADRRVGASVSQLVTSRSSSHLKLSDFRLDRPPAPVKVPVGRGVELNRDECPHGPWARNFERSKIVRDSSREVCSTNYFWRC